MPKKVLYKNPIAWLIAIAVVLVATIVIFQKLPAAAGDYDTFAQCVTDSGAKMYGAYWCPHCKVQKELFGGSWKYIEYIECAVGQGQSPRCAQDKIEGYPTWTFGDGRRVSGQMTFEQIAEYTGCELKRDDQY